MTPRGSTLAGPGPKWRRWTVALAVALGIPPALPAQLQYFGPEFRVNSTVAGSQFGPAVAVGPSGESVVAWQSGDQDGSGFGVYAQRYDSGGAAVGGEFRLSTTTAGHQVTPALAIDPAGVVLAVWASENKDGSNYAVVLRRFATDGTALGGETVVNTSTAGSQLAPRVAASAAGAVVVWSGPNVNDASQTEVYARRLSPAGTFAGGEFRVNGTTFGNQLQPAVAMDASGRFVVAWESSDAQDGSGYGVYARRYDAAGAAQGGEFLVNSVTTIYDQSAPATAFDASGAFVVVWQSSLQAGPSPIGPQPTIYGQRYDAGGAAIGGPFQVNETSNFRQELPALAADAAGGFAVVWQRTTPASGEKEIFGRRYDAGGVAATGEFPVNTTTANDQTGPALAGGGDGRYFAAWASFAQDGSSYGVYAQRFGVPVEPCAPGDTTLCLAGDRFSVRVAWRTALGTSGAGQAVALTSDTGYFWFFDESNVELVIKVLDACGLSSNFWVYAGGLTNVEATVTVTDTTTGQTRVYLNPLGTPILPIQDTGHFFVCGPTLASAPIGAPPAAADELGRRPTTVWMHALPPLDAQLPEAVATEPCAVGPTTLCLNDDRFEVSVDWDTVHGTAGEGQAVELTGDTGYFWFFAPSNVEMVIKVLDGCGIDGAFWVYAGGLTDVHARITLRDTITGLVKVYENPQQTPFLPIQDVRAFEVCGP
jgi:hypothetical protein